MWVCHMKHSGGWNTWKADDMILDQLTQLNLPTFKPFGDYIHIFSG